MIISILDLINRAAADPDHRNQVTVLPLMCGSGKSTAVSMLIRQTIERLKPDGSGDGLLVVTDSILRIEAYLNLESMKSFMLEHAEQITTLYSKTRVSALKSMDKSPVLIMTTQRYFSLDKEEVLNYLQWDGGRRTLIVFDEQPYLFQDSDLNIGSLNTVSEALLTFAAAPDHSNDEYFQQYLSWQSNPVLTWEEIRACVLRFLINDLRKSNGRTSFYCMTGERMFGYRRDTLEEITDDNGNLILGSETQITAPLTPEERSTRSTVEYEDASSVIMPDDSSVMGNDEVSDPRTAEEEIVDDPDLEQQIELAIAERQEYTVQHLAFFRFVDSQREKIRMRFPSVRETIRASIIQNKQSVLFHYRRDNGQGLKSCGYLVLLDNRELLTGLGSKVIILDGTGDISPEYKQDYIYQEDGSPSRRKLPHLSITLVKCPSSRKSARYSSLSPEFKNWIWAYLEQHFEVAKDEWVYFTYKDIEAYFRDINEEDAIREYETGHLGALTGVNTFRERHHFAQVGLNRFPQEYYYARYLKLHPETEKRLGISAEYAAFFEQLERNGDFLQFRAQFILMDTEQNIFRSSIRNADSTTPVHYVLFFDTDDRWIVNAIQRRFGADGYGATITEDRGSFDNFRILNRKSTCKGKSITNAAAFLLWHKALEVGSVYTLHEAAESLHLEKKALDKVREKNSLVKHILKTDALKQGSSKYKKREEAAYIR